MIATARIDGNSAIADEDRTNPVVPKRENADDDWAKLGNEFARSLGNRDGVLNPARMILR